MEYRDPTINLEVDDQSLPLRETVFLTLRKAILTGKLAPGERLTEIRLGNLLGTSRTPIREAIRKLELEGLVTIIPGSGARVAQITEEELQEVMEIRVALDALCARLASKRITEEEKARLRSSHVAFKEAIAKGDQIAITEADVDFHDVIIAAAKNSKLSTILERLADNLYRYRTTSATTGWSGSMTSWSRPSWEATRKGRPRRPSFTWRTRGIRSWTRSGLPTGSEKDRNHKKAKEKVCGASADLFKSYMQLFDGLCSGFFLELVDGPAPPAFFPGGLIGVELLALGVSGADDVHAADFGLDGLFYGDGIEDGFIADHVYELGAGLDPYDGKLAAAGVPGSAFDDFVRKSGLLELQPFFIDDQKTDRLLVGLDLGLLFVLALLQAFADEIQGDHSGDQHCEND